MCREAGYEPNPSTGLPTTPLDYYWSGLSLNLGFSWHWRARR
jgi:hypothetical protein